MAAPPVVPLSRRPQNEDSPGGHGGGHGGGLRVVLVALAINLLIAVFKFIAAGISGSTAMLAEAVHSLADTANQIFLLVGMRRSTRPPDYLHPFGYGTETYFWAFIVAGSIFTIGAIVSMWEGLERSGPSRTAPITPTATCAGPSLCWLSPSCWSFGRCAPR